MKQQKIIISRTDSIGDVVLTLPLAGALKAFNPDCKIIFLGRNYTCDVALLSKYVDEFVSWDDTSELNETEMINFLIKLDADVIMHVFPQGNIARISAKAKIPLRIGSTGRLYHYRYCNKLVALSRKNSEYHEAQLNFKLISPITGSKAIPTTEQIQKFYGIQPKDKLDQKWQHLIDNEKLNLILHPKSKGSAREWPLSNYTALINLLPENRIKIFITGTEEEGKLIADFLNENKLKVTNLTGKFNLKELIQFIAAADGLVAASTGPLHLSAALGKLAIGIYPPIRPMHPGRWAPIGPQSNYLVSEKECNDCRKSLHCHCIGEIEPVQVRDLIIENDKKR